MSYMPALEIRAPVRRTHAASAAIRSTAAGCGPRPACDAVLLVGAAPELPQRLARILHGMGHGTAALIHAPSAAAAHACIRQRAFALALVDPDLPDGRGIELIGWLREHAPRLPIVGIAATYAEAAFVDAMRAGASGYLLQHRDDIEIALSLRSALRGDAPIDPLLARSLLGAMTASRNAGTPTPPAPALPPCQALTERELDVLGLLDRGYSNQRIAHAIGVSRNTVATHIKRVYSKLDAHTRMQAVREARARGLLA